MASNVTVLTDTQCLTLLSQQRIGRVSVTQDALPVIVPVNYVADGMSVVFRTHQGGILARACDGNVIAFETDEFSSAADAGWSVLIVGVARLLTPSESKRALTLGLASSAGDACDQFIRLDAGRISGRDITAGWLSAIAG
jgi:nitroimidazol reductase NimA-like FMN-containing flavoprotein (pyridoxamine 5'-phosphate oxidase superfamily)